jgi:flagellar basal body-associated protein FliL
MAENEELRRKIVEFENRLCSLIKELFTKADLEDLRCYFGEETVMQEIRDALGVS